MAQSDLSKLIKDLNSLNTTQKLNTFLETKINELVVSGLEVMGLRTIGDTNQAKSIFVDIARNEFGRDISWIYDTPTNLWGNDRSEGGYDGYNVSRTRNGIEIEMIDDGLYGQEYYGTSQALDDVHEYPSPSREDAYKYAPRHISNTQDDLDDGKIAKFEAILDDIENLIADRIEGVI